MRWGTIEYSPSLILTEAPELSAQSASDVLDYLYLMIEAFENQYSQQLRQHYQSSAPILKELLDNGASNKGEK